MEYVLKTTGLTKQYGTDTVVNHVNISVKPGEIYGFLGQNGAGKTTTIRMIMGLIKPTEGEVELFGEKLSRKNLHLFERIGSIIEFPGFYPNLSAAENLEVHRKLMGMAGKNCIEECLEMVGILDARNKQVKNFSLGMKQRLGIARALLHHPELLILDEPTNGLDPAGIKEVRQLILDLAFKRKITVFMSSHILSEVEQLATRIGIIDRGKLIEEIDYDNLQLKNRNYVEIKLNNDKKAVTLLEEKLKIRDYKVTEPGIVRVYENLNSSAQMNRMLIENGLEVSEISLLRDTLEDYFLRLTGGDIHA